MPTFWTNLLNRRPIRWVLGIGGILLVMGGVAVVGWGPLKAREEPPPSPSRPRTLSANEPGNRQPTEGADASTAPVVRLSLDQQQSIDLQTEPAWSGASHDILKAPGQVIPDETRYAFITPRAPGVVRSVAGHVGEDVKAGDLLATIDSSDVAQARLELVTRLQELEIAQTRADWQEEIYQSTDELIEQLQAGQSPQEIQQRFEDRAVGKNRERLLTAYAEFRLADSMLKRYEGLRKDNAVSLEKFQQVRAEYDAELATYKALMDLVGYEARLDLSRARQDLKQAETAVRVARERLRVLGVRPDGTEPEIRGGKVVGVQPDGTLPSTAGRNQADLEKVKPEEILPGSKGKETAVVEPVGVHTDGAADRPEHSPISTYSIWAPFDGTILDRELVVPGVYVDTTHRIFQLADLSRVWIEVHVQETDFGLLARSREAVARFRSPAYPGRIFEGKVIYTGDLVDEKTRSILLLAQAPNPDRALKPGMFVEVEVLSPSETPAVYVPRSALLSEEDDQFVYVRTGPEQFERRVVTLGTQEENRVAVLKGVKAGEEVVVRGAFKLKATAERSDGDEAGTTVAQTP